MKIKITLTLSDSKIEQLALSKWYSSFIWEETNQQTPEDYIRQVYEDIVLADLGNEYVNEARKNRTEAYIAEEIAIRDTAIADIESSIA